MATLPPAITANFWDDNRFPAYTYDKISIGMIDAHEFADAPMAFKALDAALIRLRRICRRGRCRVRSSMQSRTLMSPSAGTSRTRCRRTSFWLGSAARGAATETWAFGSG